MSPSPNPTPSADPLDELVTQLLACGAVLSQMISQMVAYDSAGLSAPDAPPIPVILRTLIRDVLEEAEGRYAESEIRQAAAIVEQAVDLICDNIFLVPPNPPDHAPPVRNRGHHHRSRSRRRRRR